MEFKKCGHFKNKNSKYLKPINPTNKFKEFFNNKYKKNPYQYETKITLWTSYLGPVEVPVWESPIEDCIFLQMTTEDGVLVKVLDIQEIIDSFGAVGLPSVDYLIKINPATINIKTNKEIYDKIQKYKKYKEEEPFKSDPELINLINNTLKDLYAKNICVDIFFNTIMYLKFLKSHFNRLNINNTKHLISIYNIPDLDNAFFTGEYMVYGNGDSHFYPLGSPDVASHELTHGLTQSLSNLDYEGESGALNESFSDIFASAFYFWLYDSESYLHGSPNWKIGSLIGFNTIYLRNMENPELGPFRQPYEYKGEYWQDTNDHETDNGGVHINSGPSNKCFFLISSKIGINKSIQEYYKCLCNLKHNSQYIDYSKTLYSLSEKDHKEHVYNALEKIKIPPN